MAKYDSVTAIFENMCTVFQPDKAQNDTAIIAFDLSGEQAGRFWVKVDKGTCDSGVGEAPATADMTLMIAGEDWLAVSNGDMNAMTAFMQGKIKVQGNMGMAMKMQSWFKLG